MVSLGFTHTYVQYELLILVFVANLVAVQGISLHQLHRAIATDSNELLKLFETNSAASVPEYEVIPIVRHQSDLGVSKTTCHFKLSAFGRNFHLELEPSNDFISSSLVVTYKKPGNIWTKKLYKPLGTFYQGHVVSDSGSHVAVRDVNKSGELTGAIFTGNYVYRLHPLTNYVRKKLSLNGHQGYHVITKKRLNHSGVHGVFPEATAGPRKIKQLRERKRLRRSVGPKYIEAMILLDKVSSNYYGNTSMDYVLAVANMVHRLYRDPSIGIDVSWILTKIFIIETYEEGLDFNKQNIRSATQYLKAFSKWATPRNPAVGTAGHYDNGVLLSRRICGLVSCSLGGVAFSGVPCSSKLGYSVNNGNGIDAAFYVAHEMGHNFGIPHDSGACDKGYIMDPGQGSGPNAFQWSSCSKDMFTTVFSRVKCYNNKPPKEYQLPNILPGYKYHADAQCKMMNGPQYKRCPITLNNCALLFCYKSGGCSSPGTPPVDGTPCGKRKWCVGGKCEDIGSSLPPSVDGSWGPWGGAYSSCSRTCGVGVQYRTRQCNNPKPQFDGKHCPGSAIGDWKTCNKQACPDGSENYRLYQCKQKKPSYVTYYIRGGSECYLACSRGGGVFTIESIVADGTKFNDQPLDHDLCISGKRVEVGCDDEINSGSKLDRCAKCLGDGTTCKRVEGLYNDTGQTPGINNAVPIISLPAGATNFYIKEISATTNLLNMKLCPPNKHSRIFPDRPTYQRVQAAGVTIVYWTSSSSNLKSTESMSFVRPSTAALCPMFVQVLHEKNAGYRYTYYLPGKGPSTTFLWKAVPYGSCSEPCAQGFKFQRALCVRKDDETDVSNKFCGLGNKPDAKIPCNTHPCKAKWEPELWGQCSKRCGGGERKRRVPCAQKVYPDLYRYVEYYYCNMSSRPHQNESCNKVECGPSWSAGDWSKCVNGRSKRAIQCISIMSNGQVVHHNATMCNNGGIDLSPSDTKNCTVTAGCHLITKHSISFVLKTALFIFTLIVT